MGIDIDVCAIHRLRSIDIEFINQFGLVIHSSDRS